MVKSKLELLVLSALKKIGVDTPVVEISHPVHEQQGDFSTNAAFKYAKAVGKNPLELANEVIRLILKDSIDFLEKVEIEKPGFINFFIKPQFFFQEEKKQKSVTGKKNVVLLEFGQPNTHKAPHIGHLFSYIFGESLSRILEHQGNKVHRLNYQGDIGLHVAKCLWSISPELFDEHKNQSLKDRIKFLQQSYQQGALAYEKNKKAEKEIDILNQEIYNHQNEVETLWKETRSWSVQFYKEFEKKLGITYDKYYFESETALIGKEIVERNVGKFFVKSKGAIVFEGGKYSLHTRVFVNSNGNPTYEAKDIGLIVMKEQDFKFDTSIVTTASEQNEYWKVVIKVSELLYPKLKGNLKHLGYGMINLATGKMSSRTGKIVDAFELVEQVAQTIQKKYKTVATLAEKIALASIKYSFLRSDAYKNITFDMEKSIAKVGDSGPYLLYTYVRTQSVLAKVKSRGYMTTKNIAPEEKSVLKRLMRFNDVVGRSAELYAPHLIAQYLYSLSQEFNLFYQRYPILKAESDLSNFRIALTRQVGHVIKEGLNLLGIETVEKM